MKKKIIIAFLCLVLMLIGSSCDFLKVIEVPKHRVQWWLDEINWDTTRLHYDGKGIRVAIIDSGVDCNHPDLRSRNIKEYRVPSLTTDDDAESKKHGTAVAGIIVAEPSNENGVLGIAPGVELISIDVTDEPDGVVDVNALIQGINYSIEENVQIINISLGFLDYNQELEEAVNRAIENNIIIVASAGNDMNDSVLYPAKFDGVFCVGAYDKDKNVISPKNGGGEVIYLPGEYIVTTGSDEEDYISAEGTSIATPILSAVIALMLEKNPDYTGKEIEEILRRNFIFDVKKILET